jgi:hypothetical protein
VVITKHEYLIYNKQHQSLVTVSVLFFFLLLPFLCVFLVLICIRKIMQNINIGNSFYNDVINGTAFELNESQPLMGRNTRKRRDHDSETGFMFPVYTEPDTEGPRKQMKTSFSGNDINWTLTNTTRCTTHKVSEYNVSYATTLRPQYNTSDSVELMEQQIGYGIPLFARIDSSKVHTNSDSEKGYEILNIFDLNAKLRNGPIQSALEIQQSWKYIGFLQNVTNCSRAGSRRKSIIGTICSGTVMASNISQTGNSAPLNNNLMYMILEKRQLTEQHAMKFQFRCMFSSKPVHRDTTINIYLSVLLGVIHDNTLTRISSRQHHKFVDLMLQEQEKDYITTEQRNNYLKVLPKIRLFINAI